MKHLSPDELDPLHATSYGVGELLLAARAKGARHFVVGLGGTATCDGGAGMIGVDGLREAIKGCTVSCYATLSILLSGNTERLACSRPRKELQPQMWRCWRNGWRLRPSPA